MVQYDDPFVAPSPSERKRQYYLYRTVAPSTDAATAHNDPAWALPGRAPLDCVPLPAVAELPKLSAGAPADAAAVTKGPVRSSVGAVAGGVVKVSTPHWTSAPEKVLVQRVTVGPVSRPSVTPAAYDE